MGAFRQFIENNMDAGINIDARDSGYSLYLKQYSNKGPLIIVTDALKGQEIGRARFDLFTKKWATSNDM